MIRKFCCGILTPKIIFTANSIYLLNYFAGLLGIPLKGVFHHSSSKSVLFCCTNMSKISSVNNQITFSKYYLKITILIQNLISIFQTFVRKISKNFYINLLDHRGSNPERKDQNLACYHYTMIQFIKIQYYSSIMFI